MSSDGLAVPSRRPATLNIGSWLGVGVGLLSVLGPVTMIVMGKDSIQAFYESSLVDVLGDDAADLVGTDADLSNAYRALVVKAVIGLIVGVAILVLALVARGGSTAGRIGLAAALVIGLCAGSGLQLVELDVLPSISVVIAGITPLLSLVAIVLLFLPASNQYAAARKAAVAAG
jgi:hypothetical protein